MHQHASHSPWIARFSPLLAKGTHALDVACGSGRHVRLLHSQGAVVSAVDRDADAIAALTKEFAPPHRFVCADIENGHWPFVGEQFGALIVTNYLWRPLLPTVLDSLAPGGLLLYETFAQGNEAYGKPSRPHFLLAPAELLAACADWHVIAYEHGLLSMPDRVVQRIAARKPVDGLPASSFLSALYPA